jgi:hypothetical protein
MALRPNRHASGDPGIDAAVKITPVSPKMNKPSYNEPDCIEPLVA